MAAARDAVFSERSTIGGGKDFVWTGRDIAADRLCVALFIADGITANAISSFTSPNLTWTLRVATVDGGNNNRVEIWTAYSVGALTAEIITQVDSASAYYGLRSFVLLTISGTDASGPGDTSVAAATPADPTLTLTAAATGSYLVAGLQGRGTDDTVVDGNTTQEYSSGSWASFSYGERVYSRVSPGSGDYVLGSVGADPLSWIMAGLEVKAAAGGGGGAAVTVDKRQGRPFPFKPGQPRRR